MATTLTWLGEDEHYPEGNGPRFMTWRNVKFELGKPVETDDAYMIGKAKGNRFFTVEEGPTPEAKRGPGRPRKDEKDED